MTPTEQDNELREAILLEFKNVHRLAPADYTENCTNIVMKLITADRKRVALEARLNGKWEILSKIPDVTSVLENGKICSAYNLRIKVNREIAELKAQQEGVEYGSNR